MANLTSRMTSRARRWLLALCLLQTSSGYAADILLSATENSPAVAAFSSALSEQRPQDQVRFVPLDELPAPRLLPAATRLILLDPAALDWRLRDTQGPPTLVLRISRIQARQRLGEQQPANLSLLWSDPSPVRQLRLAQSIQPQIRRIGVLYGRDSEFLLAETRTAAASLGLQIIAQRWDNPYDSRPLQNLLKDSDVLLGLDDPTLYNPRTAKNLLLSSYARQQALIGPNAGFVKAGSLASTYSDQSDWIHVLSTLLDRPPATWPRSLYPEHFKVLSNPQVARSLGIEAIDESSVAAQLAEGESRP